MYIIYTIYINSSPIPYLILNPYYWSGYTTSSTPCKSFLTILPHFILYSSSFPFVLNSKLISKLFVCLLLLACQIRSNEYPLEGHMILQLLCPLKDLNLAFLWFGLNTHPLDARRRYTDFSQTSLRRQTAVYRPNGSLPHTPEDGIPAARCIVDPRRKTVYNLFF